MDQSGVPGGDQSPRVEVTPPPTALEGDTTVGGASETTVVSAQAALAEETTASAAVVDDSDGGDGGRRVLAGYGQETETLGAMESRGDDEASGRLEVTTSLEERTTEGHGGSGSDRVEVETETSPAREPRADLGKAPIVEEEPVEERGTSAMFTEEEQAEEIGGEAVPRQSVVDEATEALKGRKAYDEATYVPSSYSDLLLLWCGGRAYVLGEAPRGGGEGTCREVVGHTTNSFHFSFGELTVTPLDFAAITGLRVGGDLIPFDTTTGRRNRVHLSLLPALRDIGEIAHFDWGGAALGTCYAFMGSLSRRAGVSLGGYWRVWELWTYEMLGMYPFETTCPDDTILPRALCWSKEYKGVKKGRGNLNAFRLFLDELRPDQVYLRIWDRFEISYVAQSREVARGMVLFESPYGWQWYLGDRVSRQSLRLDTFRVPGPFHTLVQRAGQYTRREIERFTRPDLELEAFFQAGVGYAADNAEYQAQYLMQSLGIRAAWGAARGGRGGVGGRRGMRGGGGDRVRFLHVLINLLLQAPPEYLKEMAEAMMGLEQLARGGASRGLWQKSARMAVPQVSSAGSREEPPSKRAQHSAGTEDEPIAVSDDETDEPTDVGLEVTSGSTVPRATGTQEVTSSQAAEEVSEEDEEAGEDRDDDES
ncbi:hypothetical protein RHMOL_Rhmol08G0125200 [Rhododendron molle]|uniref:Uncharacterized protein n=1 Tax=Rhododendron molle TaxID=49168 RepID=A0ACC0MPP2_RHOML|nr:hypothetical protein RHMOL_Rhmol08G0125200 [Rhododendron molle]